jgi:2-polyprenyl-3-methyl-5-hydroxy-6-metoxy-1,4-benzoquinol methylase
MAQKETEISRAFQKEVESGKRFEFGKNWLAFLETLDDERIRVAEESIKELLMVEDLHGKTFIDVGNGSGLFSLAARRLGAKVLSFDYDDSSVLCVKELKKRYFPDDENWRITQGSVLEKDFLSSLGKFEVVYSWGVLHHTGNMWLALENVAALVADGGTLFISLYNDQGWRSNFWLKVKKLYCSSTAGKLVVCGAFFPYFAFINVVISIMQKENTFSNYKKNRGMSIYHDWIDWLGGLPFEVAKVETIFHFYRKLGFELKNLTTSNGLSVNQFVFSKTGENKASNI